MQINKLSSSLNAHVTPEQSLKYHNGPSVAPVEQGQCYCNGPAIGIYLPAYRHSKLMSRLSVSFSSTLYYLRLMGPVSQVLLKRSTEGNRRIPRGSLSPCTLPVHRAASLLASVMQQFKVS
jgi:hypothetical protein